MVPIWSTRFQHEYRCNFSHRSVPGSLGAYWLSRFHGETSDCFPCALMELDCFPWHSQCTFVDLTRGDAKTNMIMFSDFLQTSQKSNEFPDGFRSIWSTILDLVSLKPRTEVAYAGWVEALSESTKFQKIGKGKMTRKHYGCLKCVCVCVCKKNIHWACACTACIRLSLHKAYACSRLKLE